MNDTEIVGWIAAGLLTLVTPTVFAVLALIFFALRASVLYADHRRARRVTQSLESL